MKSSFEKLTSILQRLKASKIHYSLEHVREGMIMITATVPGQRWEIEVSSEGDIELEVFISSGTIFDGSQLYKLISDFSD